MTLATIQQELKEAGLYTDKVDGVWGPKTSEAFIMSLKRKNILVPKYLEAAFEDLWVKETAGDKATQRIVKMHSYTTLQSKSDEVAWCSACMCAWMEENGFSSTRSAAARSWLTWGRSVSVPSPGAVTILRRGNSQWEGHVALYLKGDESSLVLLGGNQSNMVNVQIFPRNKLLGFRTPNS